MIRTFAVAAKIASPTAVPARMTRLSSNDIIELNKRFSEWRTPDELAHLVEDAMKRLGSVDLFTQGGLAFIRDAWIAADFGRARQAEQIRLVAGNWPDFELKKDGDIEPFEAVEADDPDRRRGDEYRKSTGQLEEDSQADWIERAARASTWIDAVCRKKAEKGYSARANLVVYLNLSEYGIRQKEVEACFWAATNGAKDCFDAVWVLWKQRAYLVWKNGKANI